ncbi:hypothetical protein CTW00_00113 [Streptococcus iniae]|uniref:hypothetical protein n=1 Tax=Streptococcus iniae TaxID=1346 RepID=UPI000304E68D|nr:hypothetical protein [Streptococcus iniae]AJG26515.1 ABC transporter permease [Streptococcus iniae]ATX38356.1 hypothetical protein CTW00_00113 [Streptococcus iniae]
MNWSTIWELTKINILYSNPQSLTALKKQQEKRQKKEFSAYKAMIKNQIVMTVLFLFVYIFMFLGIDFSQNPGIFSFYVALFFVMATLSAFTTLYTIFYESNDVKLYVHLPIKPGELYIAKIISSLGMGSIFLMPLLSLFVIAYWQIIGNALAILLAIFTFLVLIVTSNVLAIYLNAIIGKLILASSHRKLISTLLMFASSIGSVGLVFFLNYSNSSRMSATGKITDTSPIPYFRGYHDLVSSPFSVATLLNFVLPILLILVLTWGIISRVMPKYYQDVLYTRPQVKDKLKRGKTNAFIDKSLRHMLTKQHLSTIQNATLLTNTYLMPLIFCISFLVPLLKAGDSISNFLGSSYFGVSFIVGVILASLGTLPTSVIGVAVSLEKENFIYLKSLPISLKTFLGEKFLVLIFLQSIFPIMAYALLSLVVLKLSLVLTMTLILGYVLTALVQGQLMFQRDCDYLNLKWQDVSQLFTRGGSQWFAMGLMFGGLIVGGVLIGFTIFLSTVTKNPLAVNFVLTLFILCVLAFGQWRVKRSFWNKLESYFEL